VQDEESVGARIAVERRLRGLTQQELARRASVSVSLLRKVEQGDRPASSGLATAAARALRVDRQKLTGQPYYSGDRRIDAVHDIVAELRREAVAHRVPAVHDHEPRSVQVLREEVSAAGRALRRADLARLGRLLPTVLEDLRDPALSAQGSEVEIMALRAAAYDMARQLAKTLGHFDLGSILADRYEWAARQSGDPLAVALAEVFSGRELDSAGEYLAARDVMAHAQAHLEPHLAEDNPAALSVYGFAHLMTALAAAHAGDDNTTWSHYAEAVETAGRTGRDRDDYRTAFGPTNTAFWGVSLAVQLMNGPEAVKRAGQIRKTAGVPRDRLGSFYVDAARGYCYQGDRRGALESLLKAREVAPQAVRYGTSARETVYALAKAERRSSETLRGLAAWMGLQG
jgi:transcriptional regulator with XRE-family HTH domain